MRSAKGLPALALAAGLVLPLASAARADILITIDKTSQHMTVAVDGAERYEWPVSTGRPGYDTPNGTFRPNRTDAEHFSQEYDNAPMPDAIFFDLNGHAIHGSYEPVGQPAASHGCVRLDPANAAKLFDLVIEEGLANTTVEITGDVTIALRNSKSAPRVRADHGQWRLNPCQRHRAPRNGRKVAPQMFVVP